MTKMELKRAIDAVTAVTAVTIPHVPPTNEILDQWVKEIQIGEDLLTTEDSLLLIREIRRLREGCVKESDRIREGLAYGFPSILDFLSRLAGRLRAAAEGQE
jgi:hypothetical protein